MQVCICLLKSIAVEFSWRIFFPDAQGQSKNIPGHCAWLSLDVEFRAARNLYTTRSGQTSGIFRPKKVEGWQRCRFTGMFVGKKLTERRKTWCLFMSFLIPSPFFFPLKSLNSHFIMAPFSSIFFDSGSNSMAPHHALWVTGHVGVPWVFSNPNPPCLSEMVETIAQQWSWAEIIDFESPRHRSMFGTMEISSRALLHNYVSSLTIWCTSGTGLT